MNIKLTAQEKIQVINGEDLFAIMQKILLRENKIDRDKEHLWIVGLAADNRILFIELVVLGGVTSATVKPMETFRVAVLKNAVSAILVHNHTSRDLTPSDADKDLTDHLIQVGRILNIPVFDHIIITTEDFLSFQYQGLMDELRRSLKWVPPYEIEERIRAEERRMREEAVRVAEEDGERRGKEEGVREGLRAGRKEGMEMGERKGEERGRLEVARAALAEGMEIGMVSRISGLLEGEVKELSSVAG
uniref:DNA repair protein RadC n=1 Tax=Candidatus Kentrum sp. DK TaxID=2126562 RepID=A0A450THF9_9GAMM|nr:MAG: DNA repair protein RadC [Candidatus Kentron sp. DK]